MFDSHIKKGIISKFDNKYKISTIELLDQVKKLIAGPDVFICDECVELCNEILDEEFFDQKDKNKDGENKESDKKKETVTETKETSAPTEEATFEPATEAEVQKPEITEEIIETPEETQIDATPEEGAEQ